RQLRRSSPQTCAKCLRRATSDERADRLNPRPEGGRPLTFVAAAPQHADAPFTGKRTELVGESSLTDPRLARDEHETATPGQGRNKACIERVKLLRAADKRCVAYKRIHDGSYAGNTCDAPMIQPCEARVSKHRIAYNANAIAAGIP